MASPEAGAAAAAADADAGQAPARDAPGDAGGERPPNVDDDVNDVDDADADDDLYTDDPPKQSNDAGEAQDAQGAQVLAQDHVPISSSAQAQTKADDDEALSSSDSGPEPTPPAPTQQAGQDHPSSSDAAAASPADGTTQAAAVPSSPGPGEAAANGPGAERAADALPPSSTSSGEAARDSTNAEPDSDVPDAHDADGAVNDDDKEEGGAEEDHAKTETETETGAQKPASPFLPYFADIAMLDTGAPGETQPSAPDVSAFSSTLETAAASPPQPAGEDIDVDRLFEAIAAAPSKPRQPPTGPAALLAAKPIPTGPAHPLPKPPTGPARMAGGKTSKVAILGSVPPGSDPTSKTGAAGAAGAAGAGATTGAAGARGAPAPRGPGAGRQPNSQREKAAVERAYQAFLAEEKAYTAVGNWETNFPEGSRMFIGNLSQERVSKRDVFDKFHVYGRLAQVAIKSAYGFVQYHTADEARAAMKNLEGVEIRGRKIHLEITKRKGNERTHDSPPEATKSRGGRGHGQDRHDARDQPSNGGRRSRDDRRDASPRRGRGRDDHYSGRDRNGRRSRDRSQSPSRHGRNGGSGHDKASYRSRRSPSPHGRSRNDRNDRNDRAERSSSIKYEEVKIRSGSDVPDVQLLVNPGLERQFVKWVQAPFQERGLRTDVLFRSPLTPPRDVLIQTHVVEGVIAVVDLNMAAQVAGKIPLQVFDRSAGASSVRFDGYQDLAPSLAADVVFRAKAATITMAQARPAHQPYQPYQQPAPYGGGYAPAAAAPAAGANDLAALAGQLDAAALAQVVAMLQGTQQQPQPQQAQAPPAYGHPQQQSAPYGMHATPQQPPVQQPQQQPAQQLDLASVLSLLGGTTPTNNYGAAAPAAYGAQYSGAPATSAPSAYQPPAGQASNDQALQAIMAQLGQFRQ